jgi:hypothetical protein
MILELCMQSVEAVTFFCVNRLQVRKDRLYLLSISHTLMLHTLKEKDLVFVIIISEISASVFFILYSPCIFSVTIYIHQLDATSLKNCIVFQNIF